MPATERWLVGVAATLPVKVTGFYGAMTPTVGVTVSKGKAMSFVLWDSRWWIEELPPKEFVEEVKWDILLELPEVLSGYMRDEFSTEMWEYLAGFLYAGESDASDILPNFEEVFMALTGYAYEIWPECEVYEGMELYLEEQYAARVYCGEVECLVLFPQEWVKNDFTKLFHEYDQWRASRAA